MKSIIVSFLLFISSIAFAEQVLVDTDTFNDLNLRAQIILNKMQNLNIKPEDYLQSKIKDTSLKIEIYNLRKDIRNFVISSSMEIIPLSNKWDEYSGSLTANSFMAQLVFENFLVELVNAKSIFEKAFKDEDQADIVYQLFMNNWYWVYEGGATEVDQRLNLNSSTPRQITSLNLIHYMIFINLITNENNFNQQFSFSKNWTQDNKRIVTEYIHVLDGSTLQRKFYYLTCFTKTANNSYILDKTYYAKVKINDLIRQLFALTDTNTNATFGNLKALQERK